MKQIIVLLWAVLGVFLFLLGFGLYNRYSSTPTINQSTIAKVTPPRTQTKVPSEKLGLKWGAYTGQTTADKREFEDIVGRKPDMISTFVLWNKENNFPTELAQETKKDNQTLVIYWESWEPKSGNLNDKRFSYDAIISGEWDDYITNFGRSIVEADQRVIIIPFVEVNGNWYPWSITKNNNSAAKHIAAYRKIHQMLNHIPNLKFGWAVNNGSAPDTKENSIENLYPGDEYVDYVGVDGFNFGDPWEDFDTVFSESLSSLKTLNKPIMIFSTASSHGSEKHKWIREMGNKLLEDPEVEGFIWFNQDKERDWRVWSDPESLASFQEMLTVIQGDQQ